MQPTEGIPLRLLITDIDLKTVLEEQSRNESVVPKNITLEDEVKLLRREHLEKLHPAPVDVTVTKMILGKPCSLELYKSLRDKEELLDEALGSRNGDAVLHVVLFLSKTLKKKLLYRILQVRPTALTCYVNYLKTKMQLSECVDLLVMLGKTHEAAMVQFSALVQSCSNIETKKNKLKRMYSDYFSQPGTNPFYSHFIATYINLLEFQLNEKAAGHSGAQSIVGTSPLETLTYVCSHHKWGDPATPTTETPLKFSETYQILPAQYEWVTLNERAKGKAWRDVETLFDKKSWHSLKAKTFQIHIPLEKVILQLHLLQAPNAVLGHFLSFMDDGQRRLALARRVGAVKGQIDAMAALKDKAGLENFKNNLTQGSEERFYAENILKNMTGKWKAEVPGIKLMRN